MNRAEVRSLLALAAACENRGWAPTTVDVDAWLLLLEHVPYDDAQQALQAHHRRTHYRVAPSDILDGVKALRADRLDRATYAIPDADPDDPTAWRQALLDGRMRAADGTQQPRDMRAIEGTFPNPPPVSRPAIEAARAAIPPRRPKPPIADDEDPGMAQARAEIAALNAARNTEPAQ